MPPLDGRLQGRSADRALNGTIDFCDRHSVAGRVITPHSDFHVGGSDDTFRVHVGRSGDILEDPLHIDRECLQAFQIRTEDLHGNLPPDARIEHENPVFNGLEKGRHKTGELLHPLQHLGA